MRRRTAAASVPVARPLAAQLFIPLLVLCAVGCSATHPESDYRVYGAVIPVASADRTRLEGSFRSRGPGAEVGGALAMGSEDADCGLMLGWLPMEHRSTGSRADLYWLEGPIILRVPFGEDSPVYFLWGLGLSALFAHLDDGPDMGGLGLGARMGLGTYLWGHGGLQVSGDAHGWAGFDSEHFRGAGAACLSATLFVAF